MEVRAHNTTGLTLVPSHITMDRLGTKREPSTFDMLARQNISTCSTIILKSNAFLLDQRLCKHDFLLDGLNSNHTNLFKLFIALDGTDGSLPSSPREMIILVAPFTDFAPGRPSFPIQDMLITTEIT